MFFGKPVPFVCVAIIEVSFISSYHTVNVIFQRKIPERRIVAFVGRYVNNTKISLPGSSASWRPWTCCGEHCCKNPQETCDRS
jgi:hypothetical protein